MPHRPVFSILDPTEATVGRRNVDRLDPESRQRASVGALPTPTQLAALGAVLCLHRSQSGGELAGWAQAMHAGVRSALDSDGLREELVFTDRDGRPCWRVCLLPDSDFLAWERLCATLPADDARCLVDTAPAVGIGQRLWTRLADRLRGERWQARALRLHAPRCSAGAGLVEQPVLAASLAVLSSLGRSIAQRIARDEGADADGLRDDCCCQQAARAAVAGRLARGAATGEPGNGDRAVDALPLIHFDAGETR